ncbi:lipoate--protein ligase family protein [Actinopolyspora saharensis]|uniref:Lipoate-protein ligase A n=1 Tax=Actinopolyspora saharensis TaxID=995062 RepID=A0A1H0ZB46_9ACTN|nr:lipoate--protein ligase family protein [Actinopolyspora saharensis]SDQ24675.1 Lipoate-protein ligase A [Actinopolyspora saharensis]
MDLLRGALETTDDQATEVGLAHALVRRVGRGAAGPAVRIYRPSAPVVAFGRRDTLRPGFDAALRAVRDAGFTPVVRAPGGRAVAYTANSLVVDHIGQDPGFLSGMDERFRGYAELWTEVLRRRGVDARVGAVPGEYCPGEHSVNAGGRVKLVGTAQRMIRGAWLFSAVAVVDDAELLRPVLAEVYRHLDLPFDPESVGSVREEAPNVALDELEQAVINAYDERFGLVPADVDEELLDDTGKLLDEHRLSTPRS